jgi:O-antigen/teichoic acid export membrane protein
MNYIRREFERIRSSTLARNAGWMLIGQVLSVVFQGVYFILLGRLLGSTEYGILVGVVAMVALVSQYSTLGTYSVLLRYVCSDPKDFRLYWGNVLATTLCLGSLFAGLLIWAGPHVASSYSTDIVMCVAVGDCIFAQLTLAAGRVFQAFEMMRLTAAISLLTNFLRTLMAGVMLWYFGHATARQWAVATLSISIIATITAVTMVTKRYGKPAFSISLLRQRLGEGFVFALSYSTGAVYNDIDKAMLGHFGMNAANGVYSMAYRVVDVATVPFNSIQAAAFPRFFQKGVGGIGSTAQYAFRMVRRTTPVALVSAFAMVIMAPIIPHLVGRGFLESVSALRWLCLIPVFRSLHISAGDALTGAGHQNLRLGTQAAVSAFNFGTNLYMIPHHGWLGAAWTSLATDGMLVLLNWGALLGLRAYVTRKTDPLSVEKSDCEVSR